MGEERLCVGQRVSGAQGTPSVAVEEKQSDRAGVNGVWRVKAGGQLPQLYATPMPNREQILISLLSHCNNNLRSPINLYFIYKFIYKSIYI